MSDAISSLRIRLTPNTEQGGALNSPMPALTRLPGTLAELGASETAPTESFSNLLSNFISGVNEQHHAAAYAQTAMMNGEDIELHDVMIQMEQASLSTDLLLEMRNRLVATVNDLTRMPM